MKRCLSVLLAFVLIFASIGINTAQAAAIQIPEVAAGDPPPTIGETTATLSGSIVRNHGIWIQQQGFEYRRVGSSSWTNITVVSSTDSNNVGGKYITANITGLTSDTEYEYRSWAKNDQNSNKGYSPVVKFRTKAVPVPEVAAGDPPPTIGETTATLSGSIVRNHGIWIQQQGFEYRRVGSSSWTNITVVSSTDSNNVGGKYITANITGLTSDTEYEYRSWAKNDQNSNKGYSPVVKFRTKVATVTSTPTPSPTTPTPTSPTSPTPSPSPITPAVGRFSSDKNNVTKGDWINVTAENISGAGRIVFVTVDKNGNEDAANQAPKSNPGNAEQYRFQMNSIYTAKIRLKVYDKDLKWCFDMDVPVSVVLPPNNITLSQMSKTNYEITVGQQFTFDNGLINASSKLIAVTLGLRHNGGDAGIIPLSIWCDGQRAYLGNFPTSTNVAEGKFNTTRLSAGVYEFTIWAKTEDYPNDAIELCQGQYTLTVKEIPSSSWNPTWPTPGSFGVNSLMYYPQSGGGHGNGIDIEGSVSNKNVVAIESGVVLNVINTCTHINTKNCGHSQDGASGNSILILHDNGYTSFYGHLAHGSITVSNNQRVSQGDKIGVMGSTGNSSGTHLHFHVRSSKGGSTIDIFKHYLRKYNGTFTYPLIQGKDGSQGIIALGRKAEYQAIASIHDWVFRNGTSSARSLDVDWVIEDFTHYNDDYNPQADVYEPSLITHTVSFNLNGGTLVTGELIQTVQQGSSAVAPVIRRNGYAFDGWDSTFDDIRSNKTVTAKWVSDTVGVSIPQVTGKIGDIVEVPIIANSIAYNGQMVLNFDSSKMTYISAEKGDILSGILADRLDNPNSLKLIFADESISQTGTLVKLQFKILNNVANGTTIPLELREIKLGDTLYNQAVYGGVLATASQKTYTVVFDLDGGTLISGEIVQTVKRGENAILPTTSKVGYDFIGWDSSVNNVIKNLTVKALWKEKVLEPTKMYDVIFNLDGGSRVGGGQLKQKVEPGKSAEPPLVEKAGYIFVKWEPSYENVTANMTVTAAWVPEPPKEKPIILGDVNGDGTIDSADALLVIKTSIGLIELSTRQKQAADVNGDGYINAGDAIIVIRTWAGYDTVLSKK